MTERSRRRFEAPFALPEGFRLLSPGDAAERFCCGDVRVDRFPLERWLAWAERPGHYVVVATYEGRLGVLAHVLLRPPVLTIELLARSAMAPRGSAGPMLTLLERIARERGCREVRLEAMGPALVAYYARFGFRQSGASRFQRGWGVVFPMVKRVA